MFKAKRLRIIKVRNAGWPRLRRSGNHPGRRRAFAPAGPQPRPVGPRHEPTLTISP